MSGYAASAAKENMNMVTRIHNQLDALDGMLSKVEERVDRLCGSRPSEVAQPTPPASGALDAIMHRLIVGYNRLQHVNDSLGRTVD